MHTVLRPIGLLLLVLTVACQPITDSDGAPSVKFVVCDRKGHLLRYRLLSVRSIDSPSVELVSKVRDGVLRDVRLGGAYSCTVEIVDRQPRFVQRGEFVVWNLASVAVIVVPVDMASVDTVGPSLFRFSLRSADHLRNKFTWVTVRPAFASTIDANAHIETAVVQDDDTFSLQGRYGGIYLLTINQPGAVIAAQVLEIPEFPSGTITVPLAK